VDELRLVYGATIDLLVGDDINRNGVLDANEKDLTGGNGQVDPGLLEYVTVYTREPNFHSDGTSLTNVNTATSVGQDCRRFSKPPESAAQARGRLHLRSIHPESAGRRTGPATACWILRCAAGNGA
jgi:hypothetical protein